MKQRTILSLIALAIILSCAASALEFPPGVVKLEQYQQNLAFSITLLIAFAGGILSFTSPCGFVVLPTFFSYLFKERKRALFMTALFSMGMTLAFIIFGIVAGFAGTFFNEYKEFFATISGMLLVLFGSMLIFGTGFSLFDFKIGKKPRKGFGVFLLGFFFAIGWTPCVGPILGGIILLAANLASVWRGAVLFGVYSLGVAAPLMLVSYFSDRYDVAKWFTSKQIKFSVFGKKVYSSLYGIIGGVLLIVVGAIMILYRGTRVFMVEIPQYLPWTMTFFTNMNQHLVDSSLFTSLPANIIGGALILLILYVMWRAVFGQKSYKE